MANKSSTTAGALRRSEIVALDVADVTPVAEGLVVNKRRSKTDQEGAGELLGVPYGSNPRARPCWPAARNRGRL